jgi:putative ABC transport system substrate-binding protein
MLGGLAASAIAARGARAQMGAVPVVGVLRSNPNDAAETFVAQFRRDMAELGWHDGRNVRVAIRFADGHVDNLSGLVTELVALQPKVMLAFGPHGMRAMEAGAHQVPVVGMTDDMVSSGFAQTMARPGGLATGVSILAAELDAKRLELLCQFVPQAKRIGVLHDTNMAGSRSPSLVVAARTLGVELVFADADSADAVGAALDRLVAARVDAVNVLASTILNGARAVIIARLREAKLPGIHQWPETAQDGGLIAYGPSLRAIYRQLAVLTDKILRGAQPASLPIEHPTKLDLIINLREAREMGLDVPVTLLARADEVIE